MYKYKINDKKVKKITYRVKGYEYKKLQINNSLEY